MTAVVYLPGVPAPSDHLAQAARLLAAVEQYELEGRDTAELEARIVALVERRIVEVWDEVKL